jgi:hypothetical protein
MRVSQSLSRASQRSGSPGPVAGSRSLQSMPAGLQAMSTIPSRSSSSVSIAAMKKSGLPLQSSSRPLHISAAAGLIDGVVSSQSVASSDAPGTTMQERVTPDARDPKPSPSSSSNQSTAPAPMSAGSGRQSFRIMSQISGCPGLIATLVSSQSPSITAKPAAPAHRVIGIVVSPYPSRSASTQPEIPTPSSGVPLQSWSSPSHTSVPPGRTLARASSQSGPHSTPPPDGLQHSSLSAPSASSSIPPCVAESQSSSWPSSSQISRLPGKRAASVSSQSSPSGMPSAFSQVASTCPSRSSSGPIARQARSASEQTSSVQVTPSSHSRGTLTQTAAGPQVSVPLQKTPSSHSPSRSQARGGPPSRAPPSGGDPPSGRGAAPSSPQPIK